MNRNRAGQSQRRGLILQTQHAALDGGPANTILIAFDTKLLQRGRHFEQLEQAGSTACAGESAVGATQTLSKAVRFRVRDTEGVHIERWWRLTLKASRTVEAHESLRDHSKQDTCRDAAFDTQFGETKNRCD